MRGVACLTRANKSVQGSTKRRAPGLVIFIPALAYHFCLALTHACSILATWGPPFGRTLCTFVCSRAKTATCFIFQWRGAESACSNLNMITANMTFKTIQRNVCSQIYVVRTADRGGLGVSCFLLVVRNLISAHSLRKSFLLPVLQTSFLLFYDIQQVAIGTPLTTLEE